MRAVIARLFRASGTKRGDPTDKQFGFDKFFGFLGGATDYFNGAGDWRKDGKPFKNFGDDFYSTDAFTDYAIEQAKRFDGREKAVLYLSFV